MCRYRKVTVVDVMDILSKDEAEGSKNGTRRFEKRVCSFDLLYQQLEAFAAHQGHSKEATNQTNMDRTFGTDGNWRHPNA